MNNKIAYYCDHIVIVTDVHAKVLDFNQAAVRFFNIGTEKIIGLSLFVVFKAHKIKLPPSIEKLVSASVADDDYQFEELIILPSPREEQHLISWIVSPYTEKDGSKKFLIIGKNISEISNYKKLLQTHQMYLSNIVENLPEYVYWKDKNLVYQGCNSLVAKYLGLNSSDEIIGKTDNDFNWDENRVNFLHTIDEAILTEGVSSTVEDPIPRADGTVGIMLTSKSPLRDEHGKIVGIVGVSMDITEQKKTEKMLREAMVAAEAANLAKSEFIANMSHDIRTPLTGVIGMARMLGEDDIDLVSSKQVANYLEQSGNQLLTMLNEILDAVSHKQINEIDVEEKPFNIRKTIQNIVELERPSALLKGLDLLTEIDDKVPACLIGDDTKLHRIILNLVGNALKFTQEGSVSIKLSCLEKNDSKIRLQVSVIDTGIGIAPEFQGKVFEKFSRATPSYKGLYAGHGLGLHIASLYAKALSGSIEFTSELDKGTTFFLELPLKIGKADAVPPVIEENVRLADQVSKPDKPKKSIEAKSTSSSPLPVGAPHLLLIEDNHIALMALQSLLRACYHFTSAGDAENALDLLMKQTFDLIITDIGLPGMSGIELVKKWRAYEQAQQKKPIPIVGLTGHAEGKAVDDCMQAGMNEVFSKPMTSEKLEQIKATYLCLAKKEKLGMDLPDTEDELFQLQQFSIFDPDSGIKGIGGDPAVFKALLHSMVYEDVPGDKLEIEEAHASCNWERVEKLAHRMKGGFVYCGTERLAHAAQYLERYYKAGHTQMLEPLYQQFLAVLAETMTILKEWLDKK